MTTKPTKRPPVRLQAYIAGGDYQTGGGFSSFYWAASPGDALLGATVDMSANTGRNDEEATDVVLMKDQIDGMVSFLADGPN